MGRTSSLKRRRISSPPSSTSSSPYKNSSVRAPRKRAPARKRGSTVTIEPGLKVPVTSELDTLWTFAAERQAIYVRRTRGDARPWTTDPVLDEGRFCNVFRVADATCQYMIHYVVHTGSQDPTELVFRVVLFDTFTRINTWEYLIKELGALTWAHYKQAAYVKALRKAAALGVSLYTGSFQKPSPSHHYKKPEAFHNHLMALEALMKGGLPDRLCNATSMEALYNWIRAFPGMGEFNTYQLLMNLTYTGLGKFTDADTFVVAGVGARAGINLCFGPDLSRETELKIMQWMQRTQREQLARLGLSCTLGPPGSPYHELQLCDIEHCLCEISKYVRHRDTGPGRSKRKFEPSTEEPLQLILPSSAITEELWVVSRITAQRTRARVHQYQVWWEGYDEPTWEPASIINEDAPSVVAAFKEIIEVT